MEPKWFPVSKVSVASPFFKEIWILRYIRFTYVSEKSIVWLAHYSFIQFDDLGNHRVQIFRSDALEPRPRLETLSDPWLYPGAEIRSAHHIATPTQAPVWSEAHNVLNIVDPFPQVTSSGSWVRLWCKVYRPLKQLVEKLNPCFDFFYIFWFFWRVFDLFWKVDWLVQKVHFNEYPSGMFMFSWRNVTLPFRWVCSRGTYPPEPVICPMLV